MGFGTSDESSFGGQDQYDTVWDNPNYSFQKKGDTEILIGCFKSSQCASGYSCIDGFCVKLDGGNDRPWSAGQCDLDTGAAGETCGSDGMMNCSVPSCSGDGGMDEPGDCCGKDIVYNQNPVTGEVTKSCETHQWKICNQYCTDYLQANAVERFGCSRKDEYGNGNSCGSCESCDDNGECAKKLDLGEDAPCWCDKGARCDKCEPCQYQDSELGDYGLCRPYEGAERNDAEDECKECVEVTDPVCPCGKTLSGNYKVCKVYFDNNYQISDPVAGLQLWIEELCAEECNECLVETPAEQCETQTIYTDTGNEAVLPICPSEATCRVSGVIRVEGAPQFATLFEICPNELFPGGCLCVPTDCNCHEDCGDCQECSAETGTCETSSKAGCQPQPEENEDLPEPYDPDTNPDGVLGV